MTIMSVLTLLLWKQQWNHRNKDWNESEEQRGSDIRGHVGNHGNGISVSNSRCVGDVDGNSPGGDILTVGERGVVAGHCIVIVGVAGGIGAVHVVVLLRTLGNRDYVYSVDVVSTWIGVFWSVLRLLSHRLWRLMERKTLKFNYRQMLFNTSTLYFIICKSLKDY